MSNLDLEEYIRANIYLKRTIEEEKLWEIFYECLNGLVYLHQKGIIHRDIKLKNIFLDDNLNIRIGDFKGF